MTTRDRESGMTLREARRIWTIEQDFRTQLDGHGSHISCSCPRRSSLPYTEADLDRAMDRLNLSPYRRGLGYPILVR